MTGSDSRRSRSSPPVGFFVVLGFIQAIWPLTMDLYLPAFPSIASELSTTPALVQLTLTGAFIGMAIGQLAAGPISDRIGRMRPLLVVLVIYTVATIGCALAPTIGTLVALRFGQGLGASASAVIVLAIIRDSSSGPTMLRLLARLQLVNGVFVVMSPAIGAQLLLVTDWRGLFWVLVGYGAALTVATLSVLLRRETNTIERRMLRGQVHLRDDYSVLFHDRRFIAVVLAGGLQWAAMMSYMSASAFLFQDFFELTPTTYALIFGAHGAMMIIGAQVSARLAGAVPVVRVLRGGTTILFAVSIALLLSVAFFPALGLIGFLVPLFVFTTTFGAISPAIQSTALSDHGERAGSAASLLGATNMIFGAVASPLVGLFGSPGAVPVAVLLALCAFGSLLCVAIGFRRTSDRRVAIS